MNDRIQGSPQQLFTSAVFARFPCISLAEIIASGQSNKPTLEKFFAINTAYEDGPNSRDYKDAGEDGLDQD